MSATEIIEQIKALSPEELRQVVAFIQTSEHDEAAHGTTVQYADDRAFDAATGRVFEKHAELFKKLAE